MCQPVGQMLLFLCWRAWKEGRWFGIPGVAVGVVVMWLILGHSVPGAQGTGTKANGAFAPEANRISDNAPNFWTCWTILLFGSSAVLPCLWGQGSVKAQAVPEGLGLYFFPLSCGCFSIWYLPLRDSSYNNVSCWLCARVFLHMQFYTYKAQKTWIIHFSVLFWHSLMTWICRSVFLRRF